MRYFYGLVLVLATLATGAHADVYKWKDAAGHIHYSDQPPNSNAAVVKGNSLPEGQSEAAMRELADKELAFKQRQEDRAKAKEKADKKEETARIKQENCENARKNLEAMNQNRPIYSVDADGQRHYLSDQERADSVARNQKALADNCPQ
jgi:hypothetical protein